MQKNTRILVAIFINDCHNVERYSIITIVSRVSATLMVKDMSIIKDEVPQTWKGQHCTEILYLYRITFMSFISGLVGTYTSESIFGTSGSGNGRPVLYSRY